MDKTDAARSSDPLGLALRLAWAHGDPGIVHLRRFAFDKTLCGKPSLGVFVSSRAVTCDECKGLAK